MVFHYSYNLHSPVNRKWRWTSFHVHICHPNSLFVEVSVQVCCLFSNWIVSLLLNFESLFILDTSPLLNYVANIFCLHLVFPSFFIGSFLGQRFLFLTKFNFFFFKVFYLCCHLEEFWPNLGWRDFFPYLFLEIYSFTCYF